MDDTIAPPPDDARPWRDTPGGSALWRLILEAFERGAR